MKGRHMKRVSNLSNADVKKLLQAWGFHHEGGNGGHIVMRHESGSRVQIIPAGRKSKTPQVALRKAAVICGVTLHEFKKGPKAT